MSVTSSKRVAVTGLGIITAIGESVETFRDGLFAGRCGIGDVSLFDTNGFASEKAAQVKRGRMETLIESKEMKRISRCDLLGLTAAKEALENSGIDLDKIDRNRFGVILGGGAGGMLSWEKYRRALWYGTGSKRPSVLLASSPCTLTDLIANSHGLAGPRTTISTACSSSATSIGYGYDLVRSGDVEAVFTGGSESLSELTFAGFNALRLVDSEPCKPFDKNRKGLSLGEGAGFLILEEWHMAKKREATIYAEILGYAINADAYHMTSPDPEAMGMSRVMAKALENANTSTDHVDYINAHGTATKVNDRMETKAIKRVFGDEKANELAVSSTKSMVGHCLGAAGGIEAVATVLALHSQKIPPTVHLNESDPNCDLDYVPNQARPSEIEIAVSNSFAFGGNNTSLVFRRA